MARARKTYLPANVLPAVVVLTFLMALSVLVIISLWETESILLLRNSHIKSRRADVRSALILYQNHPDIYSENTDNLFRLYDSVSASEVILHRKRWGLYEVMSATSVNKEIRATALFGLCGSDGTDQGFYYANNNSALTVTGNTNICGIFHGPGKGIIYGQMRSIFFNGRKLSPEMIKLSQKQLPPADANARTEVGNLLDLIDNHRESLNTDSLDVSFHNAETAIIGINKSRIRDCRLAGNIILVNDKIRIDSTCVFNDIIIIGRCITVGKGFRGSAQIFARDSLVVEKRVSLEYPSGIYSSGYAELHDETTVNGYVIVTEAGTSDIRKPAYKQSRHARVRGLLYVDGNAQLQGIVSGTVYLSRAVYYASEGYYKDMIYDASILGNNEMALPMWLNGDGRRKHMKWVR